MIQQGSARFALGLSNQEKDETSSQQEKEEEETRFCSQKSPKRHRKDVRADSKDLDVGWAGGQEMDRRLAV